MKKTIKPCWIRDPNGKTSLGVEVIDPQISGVTTLTIVHRFPLQSESYSIVSRSLVVPMNPMERIYINLAYGRSISKVRKHVQSVSTDALF